MSYASIMVPVDLGEHMPERVRLAANLAARFQAALIGVAAEQPAFAVPPVGPTPASAYALAAAGGFIQADLKRVRTTFEEAAGDCCRTAWRSGMEFPLPFLIAQAAAADLVVVGRRTNGCPPLFSVDAGDAAMHLGRPMLVVPPGIDCVYAVRVAIAWKNTREARRAVLDALPILKQTSRVAVVSIDDGHGADDGQDIVRFLQAHDIAAEAVEKRARGGPAFEVLIDTASENAADLVVAGAYGHGRMREWIFGGVTRDLLTSSPLCCLMSH